MPKSDIHVYELVNKVKRGELLLPEMQRRYIWPATKVRDLLDSLYRGYPTGTILVWETDEQVVTKELSIQPTQTPTTSSKLLLLDGQQRITSLASIMSGQPVIVRNRRRPIEILFNLEHPEGAPVEVLDIDENDYIEDLDEIEDEDSAERDIQLELKNRTFVVYNRALQNNPAWVLVSDIFKKTDKELLKPFGINSDDPRWDKYSDRLKKVRDISNYFYVMQTLEKDKSYEEVTEIFIRVNSLGIKLRSSDLALAQITSKWTGFMKQIEEFATEFKEDEDYIIESGLSVRLLTIFATHQSRFKTIGRLSVEKLKSAWRQAKDSLRFAINFVKSNAEIDNLKHISSPFLLIPIAVFGSLKGEKLTLEEEKMFLRWFFLAHMRGHYSMGSSESILDADLSSLFKNKNLADLTNILQNHVKKFFVDVNDLQGKSRRSPMFSTLYFVLKHNEAKDWFSGLCLSAKHVGKSHSLQYHHIFPKSVLREAGYEKREINEIANLAFISGMANRHILNKEPLKYFETEVIAKRGEEALTSQLIPMDKTLWQVKNYPQFLDYRRHQIADEINKYLKKYE
jgi:hypothetical protein